MAQLTTREADKYLYELAKPIIDRLSEKLGYHVYVYYPGIDAPRKPNQSRVFIEFARSVVAREPLGIQADSGFLTQLELRTVIHATEKKADYEKCANTADEFVGVFSRRRCGDDIVIMGSRWEDTEFRDGRRMFTIIIDCEYES